MKLLLEEPRDRRRGRGATGLCILLGAGAFLLIAQLVVFNYRSGNDGAAIPVFYDKLRALEEVLPEIDVVVIGSSHVYRNFDPVIFDAAMADLGCTVRSYNMGVAGMNVNEANYIVSRLRGDEAPEWLLLENLPPVRPSSFGNERSRMFMRLSSLPLAVRDILSAGTSESRRWRMLGLVLYAHAYEEAGTGMLASKLIRANQGDDEEESYWAWGESRKHRGYLALEDETAGQFVIRNQRHVAAEQHFRGVLDRYAREAGNANVAKAQRRIRYLQNVLDSMAAVVPNVALVLMPNPQKGGQSRGLELAAANGLFSYPLVNLNDPSRFDWLLNHSMWFDRTHLARSGSVLLSEALAREVCPMMSAD